MAAFFFSGNRSRAPALPLQLKMMNIETIKTVITLILLILLSSMCLGEQPGEDNLREVVTTFWNASAKQDKVTAMKYVHPEDLNTFLNKKLAVIHKWSITDVSFPESQDEAKVRVGYEMETRPGISFNLSAIETWQLVEKEWKVRVKDNSAAKNALFKMMQGGPVNKTPAEKGMTVRPETIKFYKSNLKQPAFIWIENHLEGPVTLLSLKVDETLIKVAEKPESVKPGERARIRLEYIGGEKEEENLVTEVSLEIESGEGKTSHSIKAIYNYMNAAMRWIQQKHQGANEKP